MTRRSLQKAGWGPIGLVLAVAIFELFCAFPARAQDCALLLGLVQQGFSTTEIARNTGLTGNQVEACRRELSLPIFIGPPGPPPLNAPGPPPRNAPGPPPLGAAGRPPVGRDVKRLP